LSANAIAGRETDVRKLPPRVVYAGLLHEAARRGYRPGWVSVNFRAIYGGWPAPGDPVIPEPPCEALIVWLNKQRDKWAAEQLRVAKGLPYREMERLRARQELLSWIGQEAFDAIPDR
jgi:hypothetical protein